MTEYSGKVRIFVDSEFCKLLIYKRLRIFMDAGKRFDMVGVVGSSPIAPTNKPNKIKDLQEKRGLWITQSMTKV
jgi:hypothetical protein